MKKAILLFLIIALGTNTYAAYGYHVTREMPYYVLPGTKLNITLHIQAANISKLYISQANPLWQITNISCAGILHRGFLIEWVFLPGRNKAKDTNCSYLLDIPTGARGEYVVTGTYWKDGLNIWNIDGPTRFFVLKDNQRYVIRASELWDFEMSLRPRMLAYISAWAKKH